MKRIVLPQNTGCRLPFYLATEEWVAYNLPEGDYFFLWRVNPTVICGRNQDIAKEVNLQYCDAHGIEVVRRKSGGGCVYADLNNWMISYITHSDEVQATFSRFTTTIARMLQSLGIDASATGRNDIVISERKVSGNAFYHIPGRSIVHGTMLHNIDFTTLSQAITPSRAKLESKAVKSVQAHITSLSAEGLKLTVEGFGDFANSFLSQGDSEIVLTPENISEIEKITESYYNPSFRWGRYGMPEIESHTPEISRHSRIEGVGEFTVSIDTDKGKRITSLGITGDFFVIGDMDLEIIAPIVGVEYTPEALAEAIDPTNPGAAISGLTRRDLFSLLI